MKREYKVYEIVLRSSLEEDLNKFGQEGWELVCTTDKDSDRYYLVFKRPIA